MSAEKIARIQAAALREAAKDFANPWLALGFKPTLTDLVDYLTRRADDIERQATNKRGCHICHDAAVYYTDSIDVDWCEKHYQSIYLESL